MVIMGIDPSINCTGLCVFDGVNNDYIMIPSKITKKLKTFKHKNIKIKPYDKLNVEKDNYSLSESNKCNNYYEICKIINDVINHYNPDKIIMEGVSYGSIRSAALVDLSQLQGAIRLVIKYHNIPFEIVSPTSVKKFAVDNGAAPKIDLINEWKNQDKNIKDIQGVKIDDLADSYFIAHYVLKPVTKKKKESIIKRNPKKH